LAARNFDHGHLRQRIKEVLGHNDSIQESTATLDIEEGKHAGQSYPLRKKYLTIGRSYDNDICLEDTLVSRHHASILRLEDATYLLRDEGSANGTTIDGWPLEIGKNYVLEDGARIELGRTVLIFRKN
jgi:pSer/pThr/pTyr-binding forkhead associated (FHA) protein